MVRVTSEPIASPASYISSSFLPSRFTRLIDCIHLQKVLNQHSVAYYALFVPLQVSSYLDACTKFSLAAHTYSARIEREDLTLPTPALLA